MGYSEKKSEFFLLPLRLSRSCACPRRAVGSDHPPQRNGSFWFWQGASRKNGRPTVHPVRAARFGLKPRAGRQTRSRDSRRGRRDIVDSASDALASTANYLAKAGWRSGLTSANRRARSGTKRKVAIADFQQKAGLEVKGRASVKVLKRRCGGRLRDQIRRRAEP